MSTESTDDPVQRLVESFRGLLDEALVYAIANDQDDLSQPSQYKAAQELLQALAQDVTLEEATGFNPSGLSEPHDEGHDVANDTASHSYSNSPSRPPSLAQITDSSSTDASSEGAYFIPTLTRFDTDSIETKTLNLWNMFTELKEYDITYALKKANGDFQGALDHLLNVQYLNSTGQVVKGIDGFFNEDEGVGRKGKGKGKKKRNKSVRTSLEQETDFSDFEPLSKNPEKELKHQDEIAFLADRIDLPYGDVSDIYYRKKCSSGAAAVEILDQHIALGIQTQTDQGKARARELATKYPNVPDKYMPTLVQVSISASQCADDIASLVSKHFAKNPWTKKLDLTHRVSALPNMELEVPSSPRGGKTSSRGSKATTPTLLSSPFPGPSDYGQAVQRLNDFSQAKRDAEAHASQLTRRGAGNPLYRQAAHVYTDRARESSRYISQASSMTADALVEQQSTSSTLDLHGVIVRDGVRIARQKVLAWWQNLGDFKSQKARERGYTVVTGLGRHSVGGVSQLRQAVASALLQDGWKFQVETGRFVITGRR